GGQPTLERDGSGPWALRAMPRAVVAVVLDRLWREGVRRVARQRRERAREPGRQGGCGSEREHGEAEGEQAASHVARIDTPARPAERSPGGPDDRLRGGGVIGVISVGL